MRGLRSRPGLGARLRLRLWLYVTVSMSLVPTLATAMGWLEKESDAAGAVLAASLLVGWAIWLLAVLALPAVAAATARRIPRALDVGLFNLVFLLLLAEGAVAVVQRVAPSPLLWDDASTERWISQFRGRTNTTFYRYNSRGYHDDEFLPAGPDDYVVAVVADSFGVGSVPRRYNFTTVAERRLQERLGEEYERIAIDNYGIIFLDMPEYLHLLSTEVLPSAPDQIVLAIFVGNDIVGPRRRPPPDRYRLQNWRLFQLASRVLAAGRGLESFEPRWAAGVEEGTAEEPAFLHDPALETPYFTESAFLEIESERLEIANQESRATKRRFRRFFEALDLARQWSGDALLVVLIPDEFQVNDSLYASLLATREDPSVYDRDLPQRRIANWCRKNGVRVLDLLPLLREAETSGRTYHLRDTHWNARGNRVAGEALAEALLAHPRSEPPSR